ncbi:sugar kinase [Mycobacterium sp. 852013-50091_SCH5140682]|uniref:ROK family transcriptional regulator n=1 Tax=Mycobacterium sp. 852013-50091_SCH5140682 TaxID=1834109 RepID=UPI0007EB7152|nr:ROK family transcriptional regulator [Mycobacterium sp. 852013-50091_SCH5140682]OBC02793.1 sugar kinase [Mycobacterium sp. 852013-50091_SCH5140682]
MTSSHDAVGDRNLAQDESRPKRVLGRTARAGEILELVRSGEAGTVTQLAKSLGVARSTINERIDLLQRIGLLSTAGEATFGRGRPANILAFNAKAGVTLAALVGMSGTLLAITDLEAEVLWRTQVQFDISRGPEAFVELACTEFLAALTDLDLPPSDVYGVGIGVPGDVEISTAPPVSSDLPSKRWTNFPLAERVSQRLNAPTFVDRDVNLMALGEHRTGWRDADVLVSLKVGTVVACGLVIGDSVVRGSSLMVGEIGHTKLAGVDRACLCGSRGCLNTVAGGPAVAEEIAAQGYEAHTARDVAELANAGVVPAGVAVREAGRRVGEVMATVVNLLNPDVITVWGYLVDAGDQFLVGMQESIYKFALPTSARAVTIARARLGDDAGLRGAALTVIEHTLSADAVDSLVATAQTG